MLLDDSEVHLTAGDVLIQQGTNYAWVNRSNVVCRIAFILVDAHGRGASAPQTSARNEIDRRRNIIDSPGLAKQNTTRGNAYNNIEI